MNEPRLIRQSRTVIATADHGRTLLDYLCARFTYHDAAHWQDEIAAGRLLLNGTPAAPDAVLAADDNLDYRPDPPPEPDVDFTVRLLAQRGDLAVLAKSGNLPCHPAGRFFNHTLWALLKCGLVDGLPPHDDIHFVSRLDRETSGLVLVAWTREAAAHAARALAAPSALREYCVLVEGAFPDILAARGWLWTAPDALIAKKRHFSLTPPPPGAIRPETAATHFRCLRRFDGLSELSAILETGRTHQIRATLCSLGYPVVGDKLYGVDETIFLRFIANSMTPADHQRLRLPRQALHACRITLDLGPANGGLLDVSASAPWPASL